MHPLDNPNAVPSNAFESVTLSSLAKHVETHAPHDVVLHRGQPRPNKEFIVKGPIRTPTPRRPSELPEPGKLNIHLILGRKIGHGRVARVYEATVDYAKSSPELQQLVLPPLVVKVSRRYDARHLAKEAYYYDEMECLQGSVIPRYYGFFQSTIPVDWNFGPWRRDSIVRGSRRSVDSDTESEFDDDDYSPRPNVPEEEYSSDEEPPPPPPVTPTKVSILIMERLGGLMPLGKPLPEDIIDDITSLYSNLSHLAVDHVDIRYYNILRAPPSDSPLPSLPAPFTQRTYEWRIVDFKNSYKTNRSMVVFDGYYEGYVERLLTNLPYNDIWEPWDF
ncbi:hypothetical protein QCA50_015041 [Cerrena zonata]|uniref:Protein kinase domain-containing protein n=1 Tax=Cerrena zonata TaxID=2478898 RepID=A0AAW0FRL2_9APHY